jgi:hypothetical protein
VKFQSYIKKFWKNQEMQQFLYVVSFLNIPYYVGWLLAGLEWNCFLFALRLGHWTVGLVRRDALCLSHITWYMGLWSPACYSRMSFLYSLDIKPLTPDLNPSAQRCLTRFLLGILPLELCISLIYAWKTNKYTNYSFSLLITNGSSYMFRHYISILRERS